MKAVILAAGLGKRMEHLTESVPKPMILLKNNPILFYTLNNLPDLINEIIIVVGYRGEIIKKHFGDSFQSCPIRYVFQESLKGTFYSLEEAKPFLDEKPFLVLNGDDLYDSQELSSLVSRALAFGIKSINFPYGKYLHVQLNPDKTIKGLVRPTQEDLSINIATGAYVLDKKIFSCNPVLLSTGEHGLPQTIMEVAKKYPVYAEVMNKWYPLTSPEDVAYAEDRLAEPFPLKRI